MDNDTEVLPRVGMVVLDLVWEAVEPVALPPFVSSTLRGALGRALRARACLTGAEQCQGCSLWTACAYGTTWESRPTPGVELPPEHAATPPGPYILKHVSGGEDGHLETGERIRARLKLFGAARGLLPQFVLAARDAGRRGFGRGRGEMELAEATALGRTGAPSVIYLVPYGFLTPDPPPLWWVEPRTSRRASPPPRVRLEFETPTELTGWDPNKPFDAEVFTARLTERLDVMARNHERAAPRWDIGWRLKLSQLCRPVEQTIEPVRFSRVSQRQERRVPMTGFCGSVVLEGVTAELFGLWRTAWDIHVGKKTTFGYGQVRVTAA